jgi:hypothetical protein
MAVIGGIDPTGECFGTVDVLTPLAPQAVAVAQQHATGAARRALTSIAKIDEAGGVEVAPKVGPIGVGLITREVRRPEDQGLGLSGDAIGHLPLTFGLEPRKQSDANVTGYAVSPTQDSHQNATDDEDGEDDDDDDEGLWPGQLPALPSPNKDSSRFTGNDNPPRSDAGVYLPFCPNGLPALRVRRAWFGCAVLER